MKLSMCYANIILSFTITLKVEVPLISLESEYTMAYHISAYTNQEYTISIQDKNGKEYASAKNAAGTFQSCVKMGKFDCSIPEEEKAVYIQIDGGNKTPEYMISQISANEGTGEVDNVYFSDNGVNYYALIVRIIRIPQEG